MQFKPYLLFLFVFCLACNKSGEEKSNNQGSKTKTEIAFDKTKWREKDDKDYPYRNDMLEDLISNQNLKELKMEEVFDLLGEPDRRDGNYLFYRIAQKRINIFPLHTKTLVIKFSEDSSMDWVKIHE